MKLVRSCVGLVLVAVAVNLPLASHSQTTDPASCTLTKVKDASGPEGAADSSLQCLLYKIERLERELRPFRNAKGAVVAFDRSEAATQDGSGGACPSGWSRFEPAQGRMIVGAGQLPSTLSTYPSFADNSTKAIGGEEQVTLTKKQMPTHTHSISTSKGVDKHDGLAGSQNSYGIDTDFYNPNGVYGGGYRRLHKVLEQKGGGAPHNNMPPYIALYFCKKD